MRLYVLFISRLVPVMAWISFCLVAGRYLHDRLAADGRDHAARWTFGSILTLGALLSLLFLARLGYLMAGVRAFDADRWPEADHAYSTYNRLGGTLTARMSIQWADALMHGRRFAEARAVLLEGGGESGSGTALSAGSVLLMGECFYYEGDLRQAEGAFRAAAGGKDRYLCAYFLGRIAERRGDPAAAQTFYLQSLQAAPPFFPAFYSSVRLDLAAGGTVPARQRVEEFARAYPVAARHPLFPALRAATTGGPSPEPVEFYVLAE